MIAEPIIITCAQINPTVGDIKGNARMMLDIWNQHDGHSDLIIFPELFLCGYPPEDLVLNAAFISTLEAKIDEICQASQNLESAALIPSIWRVNDVTCNAALLVEKGEVRHIFYKHKLPNNHVFDEPRTFSPGPLPEPYLFRGHSLGIMICEDIWHIEVPQYLKNHGAQVLIAINGSPFHIHQQKQRNTVATAAVKEAELDLIYLNMIGGQDDLVFDGRSFIMHKDGSVLYESPAFEEAIFSITLSSLEIATPSTLAIKQGSDYVKYTPSLQELMYKALVTGVKDYAHKNGFKNALLGLSGGIDSALVAAIATDSLGAEHVHCVLLPSEFTSNESNQDAEKCAYALNISHETIPISEIMNAFKNTIPVLKGIAHENTQSRIRGSILMALSNMNGALLLTTGNKSEVAVGYCTLYGDMNGGFNPLKDVYKTDVYKLTRWRNEQAQVIPERIITKAPTAELRANQKDEDSLPPYELLDDILRLLIDYDDIDWSSATQELQDMRAKCLKHPQDVEKIAKLLKLNEHKRYQAAPGTRISHRGFGRDRRYPLTNHFVNKIEKP
jgi:NAD+ synthase